MRSRSMRHGEEGVFLILWAVLVVALFGMIAIVLDLSALRADRRQQRAAADAAVTAGAFAIASPTPGIAGACQLTWEYATRNLGVSSAGAPCTTFPVCTGTPWEATATSGAYTITIRRPVLQTDPLMSADAVGPEIAVDFDSDIDGAACDRLGVRITSSRRPIFARALGFRGSNTPGAHSVARVQPGGPGDEPASLVLLERNDCRAARTEGVNTRLIVASANGAAGRIHADSRGDGSCPGGARVVEGVAGAAGPSIFAEHLRDAGGTVVKEARIGIFAKLMGAATAHTLWPGTVGEPNPVGSPQFGRTAIDGRFLENVRDLETAATPVVTAATLPAGFVNVTDPAPTGLGLGCSIDTPLPITTAMGSRLWFNCPGGLTVRDLTITSVDAEIVVNGPVTINSPGWVIHDARKVWVRGKTTGNRRGLDISGSFVVNNGNLGTCTARFAADRTRIGTMFVKEGDIVGNNASVQWCQQFLYLRGDAAPAATSALPAAVTPPPALPPPPGDYGSIGAINILGTSSVDWTAPNELDTRPDAADLMIHKYEDFALWTESHLSSRLNGGGGMTLGGIFFLPNANPFTIAGNSGQNINVDAQFWVRKLTVTGGSTLRMIPNPPNQVPIPTNLVVLIR